MAKTILEKILPLILSGLMIGLVSAGITIGYCQSQPMFSKGEGEAPRYATRDEMKDVISQNQEIFKQNREDFQIVFSKIDRLSQAVARLEGAQGKTGP